MRIISGNHRGKKIKAPEGLPVRPTTDMAKESLFNILNNYFFFDGIRVLDLFAGTGNISYEFAARGAISVLSVDIHPACVRFITQTAQGLQFENLRAVKADAVSYLGHCMQKYNIIFADPPFQWDSYKRIPELVFENGLLLPDGFLVLEHPGSIRFDDMPHFFQHRAYGKVNFSFFAENL